MERATRTLPSPRESDECALDESSPCDLHDILDLPSGALFESQQILHFLRDEERGCTPAAPSMEMCTSVKAVEALLEEAMTVPGEAAEPAAAAANLYQFSRSRAPLPPRRPSDRCGKAPARLGVTDSWGSGAASKWRSDKSHDEEASEPEADNKPQPKEAVSLGKDAAANWKTSKKATRPPPPPLPKPSDDSLLSLQPAAALAATAHAPVGTGDQTAAPPVQRYFPSLASQRSRRPPKPQRPRDAESEDEVQPERKSQHVRRHQLHAQKEPPKQPIVTADELHNGLQQGAPRGLNSKAGSVASAPGSEAAPSAAFGSLQPATEPSDLLHPPPIMCQNGVFEFALLSPPASSVVSTVAVVSPSGSGVLSPDSERASIATSLAASVATTRPASPKDAKDPKDPLAAANETGIIRTAVDKDGLPKERGYAAERKEWTAAEDAVIREAVQTQGFKWRRIAAQLPGRSDDAVRNRWNRLTDMDGSERPVVVAPKPSPAGTATMAEGIAVSHKRPRHSAAAHDAGGRGRTHKSVTSATAAVEAAAATAASRQGWMHLGATGGASLSNVLGGAMEHEDESLLSPPSPSLLPMPAVGAASMLAPIVDDDGDIDASYGDADVGWLDLSSLGGSERPLYDRPLFGATYESADEPAASPAGGSSSHLPPQQLNLPMPATTAVPPSTMPAAAANPYAAFAASEAARLASPGTGRPPRAPSKPRRKHSEPSGRLIWTREEDDVILRFVRQAGHKWCAASHAPHCASVPARAACRGPAA